MNFTRSISDDSRSRLLLNGNDQFTIVFWMLSQSLSPASSGRREPPRMGESVPVLPQTDRQRVNRSECDIVSSHDDGMTRYRRSPHIFPKLTRKNGLVNAKTVGIAFF